MTKQELYRDLCVEAGTHPGGEITAAEWYVECAHNISADLDETLGAAACGDVSAICEARRKCGLPSLV